jgi:CBS domain containing-hemolysin-like protein
MIELILISSVTFVVTSFCSFLTSALSSISHTRLTEMIEQDKHPASAQTMLDFKRDIHTPKTAIFLTDLVTYTLGCVSIGGYTTLHLSRIEIGLVALAVTTLLLVFAHLVPRALGERYAAQAVPFTAASVSALLVVTKPFVQVVRRFYAVVVPPHHEESTREEIDEIIESAHEEGSLDAGEYKILKNMMRFSDVQVSDVMTPRTVVFSCAADTPVREAMLLPEVRQYSRIPVCETDDLDSVMGYVLAKDILWSLVNGKPTLTLRELAREVYFIPENIQLDRALENFLNRREHLFIVVDEYGGVEGLLTMEDVMETLLGAEILDEADRITNLRQLAKQRRDQRIAMLRAQNAQVDVATAGSDDEISSIIPNPLAQYETLDTTSPETNAQEPAYF